MDKIDAIFKGLKFIVVNSTINFLYKKVTKDTEKTLTN